MINIAPKLQESPKQSPCCSFPKSPQRLFLILGSPISSSDKSLTDHSYKHSPSRKRRRILSSNLQTQAHDRGQDDKLENSSLSIQTYNYKNNVMSHEDGHGTTLQHTRFRPSLGEKTLQFCILPFGMSIALWVFTK